MDSTFSELQQPAPLSTIYSEPTNDSASAYSPNKRYSTLNDAPSNSSPKAPHSEKSLMPANSNSPNKSRVKALVEALSGESCKDNAETNDKINEIDSYINKLLDKLKVERQKISDMELTRASLRSMGATDKERQQEQENLKPVNPEQEQTEVSIKVEASPNSARSERTTETKEATKMTERPKKMVLASLDPFKAQKLSLHEILNISTQRMNFGVGMPGKISEESLEITNKTNEDIVVQIFVDCLNVEFKESEEYIYSIRRSHLYDYNDKHYLIMSPYSAASFKITLKVPNVKYENEILGEVKIGVRGVKSVTKITLNGSTIVPKVVCPKELYFKEQKCNIIKLAIKQGKKQESKFPLKNLSNVPISLDLNFYAPKNVEEDPNFQFLIHPGVVNIPPQGTVFVNIALKNLKAFGRLPEGEQKTLKKVLVASARNSAIMYTFLLVVDIC